ncbi:armadillo-type protein [Globomyces pollinis-pini]|nr:armadillo-type protein [Globomyces pollinis-pini]
MNDTNDALYPIAVLIDELKHEDIVLRLNAIKRISTIAIALGPERTRTELIPFLDESIDDEDEILLALAEELAEFVEYVGGKNFGHILLTPLETLAGVEETVVRDKAIESAAKIVVHLPQQSVETYYIPMLKRLSAGDWFTSRTSACGLYAACYPHCSPKVQDELRRLFTLLCNDDTPMVRRAAATHLSKFVKQLPPAVVISDMCPVFKSLALDEQDSVRLLTVEEFIVIAGIIKSDGVKEHLLLSLRSLCSDKSWRVRYMIAEKFAQIATSVDLDIVNEDLIPVFIRLLKDTEAEVRTAACNQLPGFCAIIQPDVVLSDILPCVRDLTVDTSQHVRSALATHISGLAPMLGKQNTIDQLLPLFLQLLKDEAAEVRLNVISKLDGVNQVIGIQLLSQSLLPAIVELAEDKQWRVRMAIIENIPLLASQLGVAFFDEKLANLCMAWLGDIVFSIREAATNNIKKLIEVFGVEWAKKMIVPKITEMSKNSNHLLRMTTVFALGSMCTVASADLLKEHILPVTIALANDPIPNIRFNAAKVLGTMGPFLKKNSLEGVLNDKVKPLLNKLKDDTDMDVRYFAQTSLKAVEAC